MELFLTAAKVWASLSDTSYSFIIGRKGRCRKVDLIFRTIDLYHLSGLHYATDIDLHLRRSEYRGEKLLSSLLSGKLNAALIEKSSSWPRIARRLAAVASLPAIVEGELSFYEFSPRKLPFYSKMEAVYLLYSEETGKGVFLFLDEASGLFYCKSAFCKELSDYRQNQTRWTLLQKTKRCGKTETLLYRRSTFNDLQNAAYVL